MRLATTMVGSGRPDFIFLHGLFGRGINWRSIADPLNSEGGYTSILVDLPNHGASDWTRTFDYERMADAVADLIQDHLSPRGDLTIVGHSMGGKVAMLIALLHPSLANRLVVVDIAPGVSSQVATFAPLVRAMQRLDLATLQRRRDADEALARDISDPTTRAFLLQNLRMRPEWHWQLNLDLLANSLDDVSDWPGFAGPGYPAPVLWLKGGRSDYIKPVHHEPMREMFPQFRLVTFPTAGHWVHADEPERTVEILRDFVESGQLVSHRSPR